MVLAATLSLRDPIDELVLRLLMLVFVVGRRPIFVADWCSLRALLYGLALSVWVFTTSSVFCELYICLTRLTWEALKTRLSCEFILITFESLVPFASELVISSCLLLISWRGMRVGLALWAGPLKIAETLWFSGPHEMIFEGLVAFAFSTTALLLFKVCLISTCGPECYSWFSVSGWTVAARLMLDLRWWFATFSIEQDYSLLLMMDCLSPTEFCLEIESLLLVLFLSLSSRPSEYSAISVVEPLWPLPPDTSVALIV